MKAFVAIALLVVQALAAPLAEEDREGKAAFTIVNFPNLDCTTVTNSLVGTCLTNVECSNLGGTADGNCAAGFGKCCLLTIAACGGDVINNGTYIANEGFPTAIQTAATCAYTVQHTTDICQLRLDFAALTLTAGTNGAVSATTDTLAITTASNNSPKTISGNNAGLHMYVDTGRSATASTITITTLAAAVDRTWNVKVRTIECTSDNRAPNGCTQYFTSDSGTLRNYGNPGTGTGAELQGQQVSICIRKNANLCTVEYQSAAFSIGMLTPAGAETTNCANSAVVIRNSVSGIASSENFCGTVLATIDGATTATAVTQTPPFVINHISNTLAAATTGFAITYDQKRCTF